MNVTASYGIIINLCAVKFIAFYQNGQLLCCHQIMLVHFPVVLSGHCHASTTVIQVVLNFITRTINQAMFLIVPICFKQIDQIDQWLNKKYTTNLCLQWRSTQTPCWIPKSTGHWFIMVAGPLSCRKCFGVCCTISGGYRWRSNQRQGKKRKQLFWSKQCSTENACVFQ